MINTATAFTVYHLLPPSLRKFTVRVIYLRTTQQTSVETFKRSCRKIDDRYSALLAKYHEPFMLTFGVVSLKPSCCSSRSRIACPSFLNYWSVIAVAVLSGLDIPGYLTISNIDFTSWYGKLHRAINKQYAGFRILTSTRLVLCGWNRILSYSYKLWNCY